MIRTLTYRDLTDKQRAHGAKKSRERLLGVLNNPFLTVDQRQTVYEKISLVGRWEKLQLDNVRFPARPAVAAAAESLRSYVETQMQETAPSPPARTPQHHKVDVIDALPVKEKVS
jgi:hypothetical protein